MVYPENFTGYKNDDDVDNDSIVEEEDVDNYKGGQFTMYATGMYLTLNDAAIDAAMQLFVICRINK